MQVFLASITEWEDDNILFEIEKPRGEVRLSEIENIQFASLEKSVCIIFILPLFLSVRILILYKSIMCPAQRSFPTSHYSWL